MDKEIKKTKKAEQQPGALEPVQVGTRPRDLVVALRRLAKDKKINARERLDACRLLILLEKRLPLSEMAALELRKTGRLTNVERQSLGSIDAAPDKVLPAITGEPAPPKEAVSEFGETEEVLFDRLLNPSKYTEEEE